MGQNEKGKQPLYEEYIQNTYQELAGLGHQSTAGAVLVQHRLSKRIAVKKKVSLESARIYQALRRLGHPNIVRVYEICQGAEDGIVVEEFISGETLGEKLEDGLLSEEDAVRYGCQVLDALQAIHKENIIHRDLTPGNVMVSSDGVVKLIDFGISRSRKEGQAKDTAILGTVGYAAPEQFGFCQTDVTTDFYAWGVLFNVMLTGRMPDEKLPEQEKYRRVIQKCIQIDPAKRYGSVEKIREDLLGKAAPKERARDGKEPFAMPGFRSGFLWKKVIAAIGYPIMILYTIESIREAYGNPTAMALEALALSAYIWMVYLALTNFARWDKKIFPFSRLSGKINIGIRITLSVFSFYYGILLENYVRHTLLHLPKKG